MYMCTTAIYILVMGVGLVGIIDDWFAKPTDDRL